MLRHILFSLVVASLVSATSLGQTIQDDYKAFGTARELEQAGKVNEAFLAFAKIPGAHHIATRIGRKSPQDYLKLLDEHSDEISTPLAQAVAADLWLALGQTEKARACVAAVAGCVAKDADGSWADDQIRSETYLADTPSRSDPSYLSSHSLLMPFQNGPGSHRDNWLIRRQLALKVQHDAATEYARIWELHRGNTRPYIVDMVVRYEEREPVYEKKLVTPVGFDDRGLQFALDYAFFLKRQGDLDKSLALLREPLLAIDMDRNPNHRPMSTATEEDLRQHPLRPSNGLVLRPFSWGSSSGVSRKEFVRLSFGAFKDAGKEHELIDELARGIKEGDNRLRRLLARIRFHQGDVDAALALEEAYVRNGEFNELTAAYRLGRVYEDAGRNEQAVEQYERASSLPYQPPDLPDAEEETRNSYMQQARAFPMQIGVPGSQATLKADIAGRLRRLYGAMGKPKKAFDAILQQFEADPRLFSDAARLEEAKTRADVARADDEFRQWLIEKTKSEQLAAHLPTMQWTLQNYEACAVALADQWRPPAGATTSPNHSFDPWRQRFAKLGEEKLRMFLVEVLEADPRNAKARLELLNLQKDFEGPDVVKMLESLLETDAAFVFRRGKGEYHRTKFRNYFDLAYRLLRIYEKEGRLDKLHRLGLRIAAGEKPFGEWWQPDTDRTRLGDENNWEEDVNGCLSLVIQRADEATLDKLQEMWKTIGDCPAQRQLARRLAGTFTSGPAADDFGWANVPKGVRLIASNRTVLSVARDDKYLYTGQPWGIAVHSHTGKPVTRVALAEAARAIAVKDGMIWVGTPMGLYRIDRDNWSCAHLYLHGDVPENRRYSRSWKEKPANYWFDNCVYTLAVDGDDLWIGTHRNIQRLNMKTLALRAYSYLELHIDSWGGFNRILPDGEYVWVACSAGLRRYNRQTDTFSRVDYGHRGVGLIAKIDGTLFGHAWLNDDLRDRPCIIDRKTLEITPILIETEVDKKPPCLNGPFSFYGMHEGRLVFGDNHPGYVYNAEIGKLQDIGKPWDRQDDPIDTILPDGFRGSELWWPQPIRSAEISGDQPLTEPICVRQIDGNRWTLFLLPDGRSVAGMHGSYTTRYEYPREDWPFRAIIWDRREGKDGLFFITRGGEKTAVTATPYGDVTTGVRVFMVVPNAAGDEAADDASSQTGHVALRDGTKTWICTDLGLSVLDPQDRVLANFTRRDGLCGNRIPSGAAADGRVFFGSAWGDHGGGLMVADPSTAVFTAYFQSDGLGTDKIARVEKERHALRVTYGVEYGRSSNSYRYRVMTPNRFDPVAGRPIDRSTAKHMSQTEANAAITAREGTAQTLTPYVGGFVIREQTIGGVKYICSTRGLVIVGAKDPLPPLVFDELEPQLTIDPHVTLKSVADSTSIHITSAADFNRLAANDNPYLRSRALMSVRHLVSKDPRPFLPALRRLTQDELANTRRVTAQLLGEASDVGAVGHLRGLLNDPDQAVRDDAAIALARVGSPPKLETFERMLEQNRDSSRRTEIVRALGQNATPEVFALLLKHPLAADGYEPRQKAYAVLGKSLLKHPEAAGVLLKAYNTDRDPGPESNYGSTRFAQEVFEHAGKKMLPVLYKALKSEDRVVRSNAARACGEIKDLSSKEPLLAALDLESGLSRGSIVWALGELKVAEALPRLAELYVDARNDERRGRHTGFRFAQATAQMQSQFESISRIDAIGADFDELSRIAEPKPIRPRKNEPLLKPETILQAVRKIGPESSQEFYRTLAAEDDVQARREAATQLAEGGEQNVAKNRPILRNLLADPDQGVRMTAAVSLLLLGEEELEKQILVWLNATEPNLRYQMVQQLERIQDGKKLRFARTALARFAATEKHRNTYQYQRLQRLLQRIP